MFQRRPWIPATTRTVTSSTNETWEITTFDGGIGRWASFKLAVAWMLSWPFRVVRSKRRPKR